MECIKDCLSCSNSFSEPGEENDVLHCMIHDEEEVDENYFCDEWN